MSYYGDNDLTGDVVYNGGGDDDFFDEDFTDSDNGSESESDEYSDDDFFGGARKKKEAANEEDEESSKHKFTVVQVSVGSYEGGRFVSSTATNAAKKAATAIFRHIDMESGAVKPRSVKGVEKEVKINSGLKRKYSSQPITGVNVNFILLRKERKSLPKYYAYTAVRNKLDDAVKIKRGNGAPIKYEYAVKLKSIELPQEYKELNEQLKKEYNAAKRAKKAALEKKEKKAEKKVAKERGEKVTKKTTKKAPAEKKTTKKAPAEKKTTKKAKKIAEVTIEDIVKSLSNTKKAVPKKPKAKAPPKEKASPKAKAPAKPKASPKAKAPAKPKASPKAKAPAKAKAPRKAMSGGSGFCSFF